MAADPRDPMDAPALRWGIIGAGKIARTFTAAVTRFTQSQVTAIASRCADKSEAFAADTGIPRAYGDYRSMVEDPAVEAVYVATPHSFHRDAALLAIAAGKPVLVEKPFAHTYSHAEDIVTAAREGEVFAMEAMWTKFLPHMLRVRRAVAEGQIGEVVHVSAEFGHRFPFDPEHRVYNRALAGGGLLDLGVYALSFIHDILGAPTAVSAIGSLASTGVDSQVSIVMAHADDAQSTAFTTTRGTSAQQATVVGTAGRIDLAGPFWRPSSIRVTQQRGAATRFEQPIENGFEFEVAAFAHGVRSGGVEGGIHSLDDTLSVVRTMDDIRRQVGVVYDADDVRS